VGNSAGIVASDEKVMMSPLLSSFWNCPLIKMRAGWSEVSSVVTAGSRNTHYRATRYGLLGPVLHRLDRASHTGAFGYAIPTHHHLVDPIRPTRRHSTTSSHCDLYVLPSPLRERFSNPRVVPRFRLSILPSMSSPTSPGSRPLHVSSSFAVRVCLRRGVVGSALPMLADVGAYWFTIATTC
jgi:hypothetical protein